MERAINMLTAATIAENFTLWWVSVLGIALVAALVVALLFWMFAGQRRDN